MGRVTWLPWVARTSIEEQVLGLGDTLNEAATILAATWMAALGERAGRMISDARLVAVAQDHAEYLVSRDAIAMQQSMHIGRGGSTPNQRVRAGGYRLPDWFREVGNSVESCAWTWQGPAQAALNLLASPNHRPHLMGEHFWEASVVYGIGAAGDAYVVVTCPYET